MALSPISKNSLADKAQIKKELDSLNQNGGLFAGFKRKRLEEQLQNLEKQASLEKEKGTIYNALSKLKQKGFVVAQGQETSLDAFRNNLACMRALNCSKVFTFKVLNLDEGALELIVFSQDEELKSYPVSLKDEKTKPEELLQKVAPDSVSLDQLEEVTKWLSNHGDTLAPVLSTKTIEERLDALMKKNACPHGAYLLHTAEKTLTLSRIDYQGKISHYKINLHLGLYTHNLDGNVVCETRTQFRKRFEGKGVPARIRIREG
jgi:hypothetical protein